MQKKTPKKIFFWLAILFSAIVFLMLNFQIAIGVLGVSSSSGNVWIELYKTFQFAGFIFLFVQLAKRINNLFSQYLASIFYLSYFVLICYFVVVHRKLDFAFFTRASGEILGMVQPFLFYLLIAFILAYLQAFLLSSIKLSLQKKYNYLILSGIFLFVIAPPLVNGKLMKNEFFFFIQSAFKSDSVIDYYQGYYKLSLQKKAKEKEDILAKGSELEKKNIPKSLENVIFLQLESINAKLVNQENTPNFLNLAKEGVFFPNFYSNGVQTILGQESILCGVPNSFDHTLVYDGSDKEILCLPEVFNNLGYKSIFAKTYNLKFANTGKFMTNIGFDEVLADRIMQAGDESSIWGYKEDIFYKRAIDYLKDNKQDAKNFIFLEVGPTNHWPFKTPEGLEKEVPYEKPNNQKERLANTTFLQDKYLKIALEGIDDIFPEKNYTLIVLGDHSWPIEVHEGNEFCGSYAYEENFLSSIVLVSGDESIERGTVVEGHYSQMDIFPSILELLGLEVASNKFSNSFVSELKAGGKKKEVEALLIQPFSDRLISFSNGEIKYQYNSTSKELLKYNLSHDPEEKRGEILTKNEKVALEFIKAKLPMLEKRKIIMHAMGGINGDEYTNSKEAFEKHYKRGRRVFEVDLSLSDDKEIIVSHGGDSKLTESDFLKRKIARKYSPFSLEELLDVMIEYSDLELVVDTKSNFNLSWDKIIKEINQKDSSLLKRIVPQIYSEKNYKNISEKYIFDKIVFTLYRSDLTEEEIFKFVQKKKNIKIVTLHKKRFSSDLAKRLEAIEVDVFVHTVNKIKEVNKFLLKGAKGIYSDYY